MAQLLAENDGGLSFHEAALVDVFFDAMIDSEDLSSLDFLRLESLVVVRSVGILVAPELTNEGAVAAVLPLALPADVVDQDHHLVCHSSLHVLRSALSEVPNQGGFVLVVVVNGSLFEAVDDPLVVCGRDVDAVLPELLNLFFGNFVILHRKGPELLLRVLCLSVHLLLVVHIELRHCLFAWQVRNESVLQKSRRIFELHIGEEVGEVELDWLTKAYFLLGFGLMRGLFLDLADVVPARLIDLVRALGGLGLFELVALPVARGVSGCGLRVFEQGRVGFEGEVVVDCIRRGDVFEGEVLEVCKDG